MASSAQTSTFKSMWVEPTRRCDLRCRSCGAERTGEDMSFELFSHVADQCFPRVDEVNLTGAGEPTMARHFEQMVDAILERYEKRLTIITNGMRLSREHRLLDRLVTPRTTLILSVDGLERTYETIRPGARWKALLRLFEAIGRRRAGNDGFRLGINFTLNRLNLRELPAIVRLAGNEWGADFISVILMQPWFRNADFYREVGVGYAELESSGVLRSAQSAANEVGIDIVLPQPPPTRALQNRNSPENDSLGALMHLARVIKWSLWATPLRKAYDVPAELFFRWPTVYRQMYRTLGLARQVCNVPYERLFVRVNGDLTPCSFLQKYPLGSFRTASLDRIIDGWRHRRFFDHLSAGYLPLECFTCDLPNCLGIYHIELSESEPRRAWDGNSCNVDV